MLYCILSPMLAAPTAHIIGTFLCWLDAAPVVGLYLANKPLGSFL